MRAAFLLLFATCAFAEQGDFRKVTPGTTLAQVRALESGELQPNSAGEYEGRTVLRYRSNEFPPLTSSIQYEFLNDTLAQTLQVFTTQHEDLNDFVTDFHAVDAKLRSSLKAPTCEQAIWIDDSLQAERIPYLERDRGLPSDILPSDPSMGLSISLNHLALVVVWNTPTVQIVHMMVGVNHKVLHRIEYNSPRGMATSIAASCRTPR